MSDNFAHARSTRKLPAQASLEQLRKQAKDLLAQFRAGDSAAVDEVHRFEAAPDLAMFSLHDAQRILARAYGFESWPKLKAFVDGANVQELAAAVQAGNMPRVRTLLRARPELVSMDMSASNEHRALHYAVLRRDADMVRLLMEAGADARKGIFPHRDATSAMALATGREYSEIVAVMEEEERLRREEMSCPNATISPAQDQITSAIRHDDTQTAISLLSADLSLIHACDREGASPLHLAAEEGNLELLEWLLARRANARKQDLRARTPLDRAALAGRPENDAAQLFPTVAAKLFQSGAEMTIYAAVALGEKAWVSEFLTADPAVLRTVYRNGGLLTLAVNHNQIEMVRLLLDRGADVDERTLLEELEEPTLSWGMPLWRAALANQYEIAQLLLDRGADPNANVYASGWPLRNAWNHKEGRLKQLLLERGAKPQPYMVAEAHDVAQAKRMLSQDPSEDVVQELAWSAADHGCAEIVELALPLLHWPPSDPRWHWILMQPIRGAGPDHESNHGFIAAMAALLKHGVDPNISRYGQTILHFAAANHGVGEADRAQFAEMLIDAGARLDLRDDLLKSTPLAWASRWGRLELVKALIRRGASIEEPDAEPWATPRAWARKMKREDVILIIG